jgi:hypothetical protein
MSAATRAGGIEAGAPSTKPIALQPASISDAVGCEVVVCIFGFLVRAMMGDG